MPTIRRCARPHHNTCWLRRRRITSGNAANTLGEWESRRGPVRSTVEELAGQQRLGVRGGATAAIQTREYAAQPAAAGVRVKPVVPVLRDVKSRNFDGQVENGDVDQVGAG